MYTWGSDAASQLGHGLRVRQRIPTHLSTLARPAYGRGGQPTKRTLPVLDVRGLGCGHRFSAAVTWSGEVWIWGELGGHTAPTPRQLERMHQATVVGIACGADHLAMLTGLQSSLNERAEDLHIDDVRLEALSREAANLERRRQADAAAAAAAAAERRARLAELHDEKLRVKLVSKLAKQRAKLEGRNRKMRKQEAKEAKEAEEAENAAGKEKQSKK